MNIFKKLFRKGNSADTPPETTAKYYLDRLYTFGKDDAVHCYIGKHYKKCIVNDNGRILDFPGVEQDERWTRQYEADPLALEPFVYFRTDFSVLPGKGYRMFWTIQPDGAYWSDGDGFGVDNDLEIVLYADINKKGYFLAPFKVYNVGVTRYI